MKIIIGFIMSLAVASLGFADYTATIADISGKVEVKNPGSSQWEKATVGMVIKSGTVVSVGLKSGALLKLGENKINVKSLTRLTVKELVEKEGKLSTDIYLDAGKVHVDVAKIAGTKQEFKVGSPVATASVRGTSFDDDTVEIEGFEGEVEMFNNAGESTFIAKGETASIDPHSLYGDMSDALDSYFYYTDDGTSLDDFFSDIPEDLIGFFDFIPDASDYLDYLYGSSTTLTVTIK